MDKELEDKGEAGRQRLTKMELDDKNGRNQRWPIKTWKTKREKDRARR